MRKYNRSGAQGHCNNQRTRGDVGSHDTRGRLAGLPPLGQPNSGEGGGKIWEGGQLVQAPQDVDQQRCARAAEAEQDDGSHQRIDAASEPRTQPESRPDGEEGPRDDEANGHREARKCGPERQPPDRTQHHSGEQPAHTYSTGGSWLSRSVGRTL